MKEPLCGVAADGRSLWQSVTQKSLTTTPFSGRADVEIAIVGGGIQVCRSRFIWPQPANSRSCWKRPDAARAPPGRARVSWHHSSCA